MKAAPNAAAAAIPQAKLKIISRDWTATGRVMKWPAIPVVSRHCTNRLAFNTNDKNDKS